jgi:sedoheptulokinase
MANNDLKMSLVPIVVEQDGRGERKNADGVSYAAALAKLTGYAGLASGYGAVTHYYNTCNGCVPREAVGFCSIGDYIGMKLVGGHDGYAHRCKTHQSNAASFGLYDLRAGCFDAHAIIKAGMDPDFFPDVERDCAILGETERKIPVSCCIGDNQASFIGSVAKPDETILINVGTGGQISMCGDSMDCMPQLEPRPFIGNQFLHVGSTLCGGRAYAALERFFSSVLEMAGVAAPVPLYGAMEKATLDHMPDPLTVSTKFCGTRQAPELRGGVHNIGVDNFTPAHLIDGVVNGIAGELYELYGCYGDKDRRGVLVGSGNGLRKNRLLRRRIADIFGMPLSIPAHTEEAAFGSALFALTACGYFKGLAEAQSIIRYIAGI